MGCLEVKMTLLNTPLNAHVFLMGKRMSVRVSSVCGIDLSWEGTSTHEDEVLYDASMDNLLVKME